MGERLIVLQNYFHQLRPLSVESNIAGNLSSSFNIVVNDIQEVTPKSVVLTSNAGQMTIYEEEIYRISPVAADGTFVMFMDGGTQLRFSPLG